ncbi:MAG: protein kinase [Planctomycetota bacterium]
MIKNEEPPPASSPLDKALEAFREAWIDGAPPDPDEFCRTHQDCGPGLRERIDEFLFAAQGLRALRESVRRWDPLADHARTTTEGETILADFRILREVGRGGMGVVYEGEQLSLRRTAALKVLPAHITLQGRTVERFRREASTAAKLRHPGIVEVYSVGEAEGAHYFAMPFVEGAPLDLVIEWLQQRESPHNLHGSHLGRGVAATAHRKTVAGARAAEAGATSASEQVWKRPYVEAVCRLVLQVADALEHAHEAGVIHRDVKPSNILVREDGTALLTDFGLAREEGLATLTLTGEVAGTPYYLSPEQAMARPSILDPRTDVYSLGVTLFELLTLRRPFEGKSTREVIERLLSGAEPGSPRRLNRLVPRDLETICLNAMQSDRRHRYQSAKELADDLRRFLERRPVHARPLGHLTRTLRLVRRNPAWSALVAFSLLGFAVSVVLAVLYGSEARSARDSRDTTRDVLDSFVRMWGFAPIGPLDAINRDTLRMGAIARGETTSSREYVRQALKQLPGMSPGSPELEALRRYVLGTICRQLGMYEEAEGILEEARDWYAMAPRSEVLEACDLLHQLAAVYHDWSAQMSEDAREGLTFSPDGQTLMLQDKAEGLYREALESALGELGIGHVKTLTIRNNLAMLLASRAKTEEAERLLRESIERGAAGDAVARRELARARYELALIHYNRLWEAAAGGVIDEAMLQEARQLAGAALVGTEERELSYRSRVALVDAIEYLVEERKNGESAHAPPPSPDIPRLFFSVTREVGAADGSRCTQAAILGCHPLAPTEARMEVDFREVGINGLAVDPISRDLAYAESVTTGVGRTSWRIRVHVLEDPPLQEDALVFESTSAVQDLAWDPGGKGIFFSLASRGEEAPASEICWVDLDKPPDQKPQQLLGKPRQYHAFPAISPDGRSIAYIHYPWNSAASACDVWLATLDGARAAGEPRRITADTLEDQYCTFSPDGKFLYWTTRWCSDYKVPPTSMSWVYRAPLNDLRALETVPGTATRCTIASFSVSGSGSELIALCEGDLVELRGSIRIIDGSGRTLHTIRSDKWCPRYVAWER